MKANQINAAALANTAREVIAMCDNKKYTVAKIIAHWNLCVEQAGMTGTFDCPTCYKRKASIVGDMQRIALQLDRIADDRDPLTGDRNSINDPRCDDEGNDPREWCGNDIEAAHAEALEFNLEVDQVAGDSQWDEWANQHDSRKTNAQKIESDHDEALEINAQVDAELCKLARVIAGVNRSTYKHETKSQLIGAACAGVVDGARERLGVILSRDRLVETVARAVVASK